MKKLLLTIILMTTSFIANADDWVKMTDTPTVATYAKKGSFITDTGIHALLVRFVNKDEAQATHFAYAFIEDSVCSQGQGVIRYMDLDLNPNSVAKDNVVIGGHTVSAAIAQLICAAAKQQNTNPEYKM